MARRTAFRRGLYNTSSSINMMISDYKKFVGVVETDVTRILQKAADMTLDATLPLVPLETGALRESGRATVVKTGKGQAAMVSFGGPEASVRPTKNAPAGIVDYAAVVNYDTETPRNIGGPFFLEQGAAESKDAVDTYIMQELRKIKP